jgi:two-component system cell cycle sensor histidine kinase/response regulator CckA
MCFTFSVMDEKVRSAWFEALSAEAGAGLWVADPAFSRFLYLSEGFERIWGGPVDELLEDAGPFFDAIVPADRAEVVDSDGLPLSRDRQEPWDSEFRIRARDGVVRWIRNHGRPVRDDAGGFTGFAGLARDVTEEKAVIEEHRQAREELAAVFRALPDLVLVVSADGRYLRVASGDPEQLYRPESDLVGRSFHEVLPAPTAEWFLDRVRESLDAEHPVNFRYPLEIGDRTEWFDAILVPMAGDRVLWVARTITDRMELERQLSHAGKLDALGQLAGGIAHDFNNVITVIRGTTALMAESVTDPGILADLGDIRDAANRASSLTRQLLAFSRQQVLRTEPVVVGEVIDQMGRMLARIIGEHIDLEIVTDSDRWTVMIDPGQLEQIVANLVLNARDAVGDSGRIRVQAETIRIGPEDELVDAGILSSGDHVALTVTDTGAGMSGEVLDRAFEPFFTTKPAGEGTGLGLSMVYGTVRQSGGHVEIESEPGAGTTIRILLPRAGSEGRKRDRPTPKDRPRSARVLLVEDETPVRHVVRRFLEGSGHTVQEAANGHEAMEVIDPASPPDLVISDLVMPRMGGAALIQALRERHPDIPVILMSGYTGREATARTEIDQAAGFISKPFGRAELERVINAVLPPP